MPTLAIMIGYAVWFMFVISWNVTARPARTSATPGAPRERLYGLVIALGLAMLVVAPFLLPRGGFQLWINPPLLAWAMLLIVAAGVALCWWARLHLGRLWSANVTHKEGHRVVDTGPYRLVRHPIYTGFIVMDVGLALLCGSALAFAGAAVITVGLWIKARLEEHFLIEELGAAAYRTYQSRTPMLVPRMPLPRMPLLLIFCLLYRGFLGAAGTTIDIATPMPAPEWARLERRILADSVPAVKTFFAKYYDERGYFRHVVRWGANDGPDDAFENTTGWPELHALGASDEILQLHLKAWEGMLRQFTEARTTDVPIGRQGMYYKDFSVQSDWMHHGEALRTFNVLALSVPALPAYQKRARTYASLYMGEDPDAPNYDPQHKIIKSMINGSRGPMLRKATALDWVGDPFDVSKFVALHGEDSYAQFLAHYQEYTDVVGDHFLNLVATTLPLNAYLLDNEPKYKRWLVEYMDAWLARMKRNSGVIPSYVALDGTVGGPEGKWWNNAYGWGFSPVNPVTGQREDRNRIPRATVGFANAMLVTGDQKYADAWRAMIDAVNSHARTVDGRTEYPTMYGDRGWYGWRAAPWNVGALELWYWSMKSEDRPRIGRNAWVEYLEGKSPDFPATALKRDLDSIPRRIAEMQKDPTTPETRLADNAMEFNPAAVSGLVQLMWGAMVPGREGSLLSARLRYFDPVRRRAGVPDDVAALVSELRDDRTVVTLVNVSTTTPRDVVVQGGGYGEHQILSADVNGRTRSINARDFTVRLAPGAGATLTLAMKRYANPPSAKFPWDR